MSATESPPWATHLIKQAGALSSLTARAHCEAQRANQDCTRSRQLLSNLQRRVEAAEGCKQRETRRMITLETVEGLSNDLERLVGTLAWQEARHAATIPHPNSPAVPGSLAWYRTLHGAPQTEMADVAARAPSMGDRIARLDRIAAEAKARGAAPPCRYVAASGVGGGSQPPQSDSEGKPGPSEDAGAHSDAESDTGSELSESSSSWSASAHPLSDDELCESPPRVKGARQRFKATRRSPSSTDTRGIEPPFLGDAAVTGFGCDPRPLDGRIARPPARSSEAAVAEHRSSPRTAERTGPTTGERARFSQPLSLDDAFAEAAVQ